MLTVLQHSIKLIVNITFIFYCNSFLYIFSLIYLRCCCGQSRTTHPTIAGIEAGSPGDVWVPFKHTRPHPTDAYGTIEFQGGAHPTKAQVSNFILQIYTIHIYDYTIPILIQPEYT